MTVTDRDIMERDGELAAWRGVLTDARTVNGHPFDDGMVENTLRLMAVANILFNRMVGAGAISCSFSLTEDGLIDTVNDLERRNAEADSVGIRRVAAALRAAAPTLLNATPIPVEALYLAYASWRRDQPFTHDDFVRQIGAFASWPLETYAELLGLVRRVDGPGLAALPQPGGPAAPASTAPEGVCDALAVAADLVRENPERAEALIRAAIQQLGG